MAPGPENRTRSRSHGPSLVVRSSDCHRPAQERTIGMAAARPHQPTVEPGTLLGGRLACLFQLVARRAVPGNPPKDAETGGRSGRNRGD